MKQINKTLKTSAVAVAAALALVACGGGGGGGGGATTALSGVVSGGAFQEGANVKICGASGGCSATKVAGAGGSYSFLDTELTGISKPYLVQAAFGGTTYYAVANSGSGSTANINAGTSIAAMLALGPNINAIMAGTGTALGSLTSTQLTTAYEQAVILIRSIAAAMGETVTVTGESSFLASSLTEGSGLDKVLAQLEVSITAGGNITIASGGNPITGYNGVAVSTVTSATATTASGAVAGDLRVWDETGLIGQTGLVAWLQSVFQNGGTTGDNSGRINTCTGSITGLFSTCATSGTTTIGASPVSGAAVSGSGVTLTGMEKLGQTGTAVSGLTYITGRNISLLWKNGSTTGRLYFNVDKGTPGGTWKLNGYSHTTPLP